MPAMQSMKGAARRCLILWVLGILPAAGAGEMERRPESLASRMQRLEDREEIVRLLHSYGKFLDAGDFVSFSKLFAENDGEWIGGLGRAKGSRAIRSLMEEKIGARTRKADAPACHLFANEVIEAEGDRARASSKWIFVVQGDAGKPQLIFIGHYEDSLVREKGQWKFLRRTVYADIPPDAPQPL